jgi:hypothetical protein
VEHVLFQYHVASSAVPASQRGRSIANWAAHDYPGSFLFAWYFIGDGHTPNTLRVLRYDRRTGIASNTVLTDSPATRASFLGQFPVPCMGSSASVAEREGTIYVETHLTPSASCTLVLDHHLTLKTALSGWLLGFVSDRYAVFRESMIHFAPTHPMNISVYDAVTGRSTRVYPLPGDRLRAEYVRSLDAHLPSRSWAVSTTNRAGQVILRATCRSGGMTRVFCRRTMARGHSDLKQSLCPRALVQPRKLPSVTAS